MTSPPLGSSSTPPDRVRALIESFLGDDGYEAGPVDPEAARRFIEDTQVAWEAYRVGG